LSSKKIKKIILFFLKKDLTKTILFAIMNIEIKKERNKQKLIQEGKRMSDKMFFKSMSKSIGDLVNETKDSLTFIENNVITTYLFEKNGMIKDLIIKKI
jgi:hypothetical protein